MLATIFKAAATSPIGRGAAKYREGVLTFIQEFSLASAGGIGMVMGLSKLRGLVLPQSTMGVVLDALHTGSLAIAAGTAIPIAANFIDAKLRGKDPEIADVLTPHSDLKMALAGMLGGGLMALSFALGSSSMVGHDLNNDKIKDKLQLSSLSSLPQEALEMAEYYIPPIKLLFPQ